MNTQPLLADRIESTPVLSGTQWRYAGLIAGGHSRSSIAAKLGVSPETVKSQIAEILHRTGTKTQAAAIFELLRRGELTPEDVERINRPTLALVP